MDYFCNNQTSSQRNGLNFFHFTCGFNNFCPVLSFMRGQKRSKFFSSSFYSSRVFLKGKKRSCVATPALLPKLLLMFLWTRPAWPEADDNGSVVAHKAKALLPSLWLPGQLQSLVACCRGCLPISASNRGLNTGSLMAQASNKISNYICRVISINRRKKQVTEVLHVRRIPHSPRLVSPLKVSLWKICS